MTGSLNGVPNPYVGNRLFVGRQSELAEINRKLGRGESVLLIGGRRCGKTTLVGQISDLRMDNDKTRRVIHMDAGGWNLESEAAAIESMGHELGHPCTTRDHLKGALNADAPIAVVIDEADRLLHHGWAGSFLSYLRWIDGTFMRTKIAFVLVGGPELCGYRNPDDRGSPPFNIAEPVYLDPLDYAARRELLTRLASPADERVVFENVGGHPWLLTRLLARLFDNPGMDPALESLFATAMVHFDEWKRQLGEEGVQFLHALPPGGISKSALSNDPKWKRHKKSAVLARSLCLVDLSEDGQILLPCPKIVRDWLVGAAPKYQPPYDLAISYASENRDIARAIWQQLEQRGNHRVFFADENPSTWGESLEDLLPGMFGGNSRYVLVLASQEYVNKYWTRVELAAALGSAVKHGRILILDLGCVPPEIPPDIVVKRSTPDSLVGLIAALEAKLGSINGI